MPILQNPDPLEPRLDPALGMGGDGVTPGADSYRTESAQAETSIGGLDTTSWLRLVGQNKSQGRRFMQNSALASWQEAQLYYRSIHGAGSRYNKEQHKARSKYFKPKTRAAVRKNLTATANALFHSDDVLVMSAEDESNPVQRANAALLRQIINLRFSNNTMKTGVPWFETAIGARFDTQLHAVCVSKQSWIYKTRKKDVEVEVEKPIVHPDTGQQMMGMDGNPLTELVKEMQTVKDVVIDRPDIELIPPENVILSPNAPWINPAQGSPYLIVIWPMQVDDVKEMMAKEGSATPWIEVDDATLMSAAYSDADIRGMKDAREGSGQASQTQKSGSDQAGPDGKVIEVWETFTRRNGVDYHSWTVKDKALLSHPTPVEEVYPWARGARPIVIGYDVLEPHVVYRQSHVASWKQSQDQINDFSNLHMDGTRQSVFPTAKVKAGRNIDFKAVQRRNGDGVILVREQDDVEWDRPPAPPANTYQEVNLLSNDFDEIAGIFSQNSVQSNRSLNETVGGMQMISQNANATSEFDLRVFLSTWVEPVLSQIVLLEQHYEDDENLIAIAGKAAKVFQRFGIDQITDEMLESPVTLKVDVNIGSSDPMQRLIKFKNTMGMALPFIQLGQQSGQVQMQFEEILQEIFGLAGYQNGAERFVKVDPNAKPQIGPEQMQALQQQMQQLGQENQQLKQQLQDKTGSLMIQAKSAQQKAQLDAQTASHKADLETQVAEQKAQADFKIRMLELLRDTLDARISAGQQTEAAQLDQNIELMLGLLDRGTQAHLQQQELDHTANLNQQRLTHEQTHAAAKLKQDGQIARQQARQRATTAPTPRK